MTNQRRNSTTRAAFAPPGAQPEEEVSTMQATLNSSRLTIAAALCALLTALVGTSLVPALAGNDSQARMPIPGMPLGGCPPQC